MFPLCVLTFHSHHSTSYVDLNIVTPCTSLLGPPFVRLPLIVYVDCMALSNPALNWGAQPYALSLFYNEPQETAPIAEWSNLLLLTAVGLLPLPFLGIWPGTR